MGCGREHICVKFSWVWTPNRPCKRAYRGQHVHARESVGDTEMPMQPVTGARICVCGIAEKLHCRSVRAVSHAVPDSSKACDS
eukprot:363335-Chlamydomonas_euryale.AAC.10